MSINICEYYQHTYQSQASRSSSSSLLNINEYSTFHISSSISATSHVRMGSRYFIDIHKLEPIYAKSFSISINTWVFVKYLRKRRVILYELLLKNGQADLCHMSKCKSFQMVIMLLPHSLSTLTRQFSNWRWSRCLAMFPTD